MGAFPHAANARARIKLVIGRRAHTSGLRKTRPPSALRSSDLHGRNGECPERAGHVGRIHAAKTERATAQVVGMRAIRSSERSAQMTRRSAKRTNLTVGPAAARGFGRSPCKETDLNDIGDTIEEAVVTALERKSALARSLLGDQGAGELVASFTQQEMCDLLTSNRLPALGDPAGEPSAVGSV